MYSIITSIITLLDANVAEALVAEVLHKISLSITKISFEATWILTLLAADASTVPTPSDVQCKNPDHRTLKIPLFLQL